MRATAKRCAKRCRRPRSCSKRSLPKRACRSLLRKDIRKAREDREKGVVPKVPEKRTKIEAVRDQDNRVTEYVVTPGSTQIPYTMENRAERPIDTSPGGNSQGTLGTPKFLQFGW